MRQERRRLLALGGLALLTACGRPAPPTPGLRSVMPATATAAPPPATPEEAVTQVVAAEAEAVRQQDIDALERLWLPGGTFTDAHHTATEPHDDAHWVGWPEVRQRYVDHVLAHYAEPELAPRPRVSVPVVRVANGQAEVAVAGPDGITLDEFWRLELTDGAWRIAELTVNLAPIFAPAAQP